jgi:hypothetical protein
MQLLSLHTSTGGWTTMDAGNRNAPGPRVGGFFKILQLVDHRRSVALLSLRFSAQSFGHPRP